MPKYSLPRKSTSRNMRQLRVSEILRDSFHDSSQLLQSLIGESLINDVESLFEEIECLKSISRELFKGYNSQAMLLGKDDFNSSILTRKISMLLEKLKTMDQCEEDVEEGHRELIDFVFRKKLEFGRDSATELTEGLEGLSAEIHDGGRQLEALADTIRNFLVRSKQNLHIQIEELRQAIEDGQDQRCQPTIGELKRFSDILEKRIQKAEKASHFERVTSSSRATRAHISRHTSSAPAPHLQQQESLEDIEQLLEQMSALDTPIEMPRRSPSPSLRQSVSKDSPTPSKRPIVPLQRIPHPPSAPTPQPPTSLPQYSLSSKQIARYSVKPKPPLKPLSQVPSPRTTRIVLTKKQGARPLRLPVAPPNT